MSGILQNLRRNDIAVPLWLGQILSNIPYSCRPIVGKSYRNSSREIKEYQNYSIEQKRNYVFEKFRKIVDYSYNNIGFYKTFYDSQHFSIDKLKSFDDIQRIPIIDKQVLLNYPLDYRSNVNQPKFLVNTGGSSGVTLSFYRQPYLIGHEWAHIHKMWSSLGFKQSNLVLCITGRSAVRNGVEYDFARHQISLDMYKPYSETSTNLKKILARHPCYYLHGYPSTLSDFAEYCSTDPELLDMLKGKLRGAFLNPEFPYDFYRTPIEKNFGIPTQSFYGHTESCVLAYETPTKYRYVPFQTYGFAEAEKLESSHFDLIGTNYYNLASPLIRYNTHDIIDNPEYDADILSGFDIIEGRSGQFVIDRNGRKISLTGLLMGRHHKLFDVCSHIQIGQKIDGKSTIYYVLKREQTEDIKPDLMFDASNVDIDFNFVRLENPIRTKAGKVNLLVR